MTRLRAIIHWLGPFGPNPLLSGLLVGVLIFVVVFGGIELWKSLV